jgi:phenylacetate-CoA ligase
MPGTDNRRIIEIIKDLGPYYDQTIVLGYPPTLRTFLLEGIEQGIDWKRYNLKLMIGGEPVSTKWKEYMLELIGSSDLNDIQVTFAMSEIGVVSFETPISALIRQITHQDHALGRKLFGQGAIAALTQYLPQNRWIEAEGEELIMTTAGATPLVRYNTHDLGGVIPYGEMLDTLKEVGYDVPELLKQNGLLLEEVWQWPFFYSKGRSDSISLLGANIYPENLEDFMHKHHRVNDFKIAVHQSSSQRPDFRVYLELREGITLDTEEVTELEARAQSDIHDLLMENNDDYVQSYNEDPEALTPAVEVQEHRTGVFTDTGQKQRHVMKYTE